MTQHKHEQTKTTKEIVEFYYLWKKTSHYKVSPRAWGVSSDAGGKGGSVLCFVLIAALEEVVRARGAHLRE
eukprot:scaffold492_cov257-Pinguiococcus_pyrenoidosus.AAC.21